MNRYLSHSLIAIAVATSPAVAQEKSIKSPLVEPGLLNKAQPQFEQIFQFDFDGAKLKLDRKGWGDAPKVQPKGNVVNFNNAPPIEQIFNQIRSIGGPISSSGGSMSTRYRDMHFGGANLSGRIRTSDETVRMELQEGGGTQRSLEWSDDGQGTLRMMISNQAGDLVLLQQYKQGTTAVTGVVAGKAFAASGPSFLALYKQHRELLDTQVLPTFQALSIRLMPSPTTPEMKRAVLALLTRTPELLAEGKKLMADLDSEKFPTRDKASKLLNDRFEVYKDLIQERLKNSNLSQEAASRLHKIMSAHPEAHKVSQTIAALDLLRDPAYLVLLLDEADSADRGKVVVQLESVTGQRLGADAAAWKKLIQSQKK